MTIKLLTKKRLQFTLSGFISLCTVIGCYQLFKPLPEGLSQTFPLRSAQNIKFLADYTYLKADGSRQSEQSIFDEVMRLINQAKKMIVIDMFLFNDFQGAKPETQRLISGELTRTLIQRKKAIPSLKITLITDPFNTIYGGLEVEQFKALENAGIQVIFTDLKKLRDSNPVWSSIWRLLFQWFDNHPEAGWLPSPVSPGKVTLRSYLTLLNFKANHRKTLVVDEKDNWTGLVTTANPHDGSSAHSNVALRFSGQAALDLLKSEITVIQMSQPLQMANSTSLSPPTVPNSAKSPEQLQIVTEADIRDALIKAIDSTTSEDHIRIAIFYFSHRKIVAALKNAQLRGVDIKILMDPNKDAFGRKKNGIPNRQVAMELHQAGIDVKWCDTHGEQCHTKMTIITGQNRHSELILGSANYTRRNIDDFNLETSVRLLSKLDSPAINDAITYFDTNWDNRGNKQYSVPYKAYSDHSTLRYWQYRIMELTGWSTF